MGHLPKDITMEILARIPCFITLLQYKTVSKTWCSIIEGPHFSIKHFNYNNINNYYSSFTQVDTPFSYLLLRNGEFCILQDDTSTVKFSKMNNIANSDILNTRLDGGWVVPLPIPVSTITIVGSSNGLVCFTCHDLLRNSETLQVSNPATGEYHSLPNIDVTPDFYVLPSGLAIALGFGFDPLTKEFKVVQVCQKRSDINDHLEIEVHIYTLGHNSWKKIRSAPVQYRISGPGVFLDGSLHWMFAHCILSFDMWGDIFEEIPTPEFGLRSRELDRKLLVLGGYLSICLTTCTLGRDRIDIWLKKESWTNQFVISRKILGCGLCLCSPMFIRKNGELVLVCSKTRSLVSYNPADGKAISLKDYKHPECDFSWGNSQTFPYVGNLLSPKHAK